MSNSVERLASALSNRYRIESELGAGGMATVYLAEDLKHHRKVAVKVLRPELAAILGAERFLKEIEVTANLQHPHILPLFDSGEADSFLYYVTPYVEGESLRDKLHGEKQLSIEESIEITKAVASALDYAHRRDVIHRDIKPENILLQDGVALVADFGIALALDAADASRITETGLSLGTPHYMSPEQASGERALDGRSDLYALACMLYEMLAGEPPFTGPSAQAVMARHAVDPVPSMRTVRRTVTQAVEAAVTKALAKSPADRFATVREFADALTTAALAPVRSDQKSIAVLPFDSMSADPEDEYFSDGITEDIIAQVSKIRELRVISRTSIMRYKDRKDKSLSAIGDELNVGAILEGSVRRAGNRVRVVAQLIDVKADRHVWAETYDRELTDIFAIQSDVAQRIGAALEATLSRDEQERIELKPTDDLEAYKAYLQGLYFSNKRTEDALRTSIEYFEEALDRDPAYALAYVGVAHSSITLAYFGAALPEQAYPKARMAATKALEIDETLAGAHIALAAVKHDYDWDWTGAEREFRRGIELNPSDATGHHWYGFFLTGMGRGDEGLVQLRQAHALDPISPIINAEIGLPFYYGRRYEEAIAQYRKTIDMDRDFAVAHYFLGQVHGQQQMFDEAIAEFEEARRLSGSDAYAVAALGWGYAIAGRRNEAAGTLKELEDLAKEKYVSPYRTAEIHAALGDQDRAFECLEEAFHQRSVSMVFLKVDPSFDVLRPDPRFKALLERIGLE